MNHISSTASRLLSLLLFSALAACQQQPVVFRKPTLVDSTAVPADVAYVPSGAWLAREAYLPICYIGPNTDTIRLGDRMIVKPYINAAGDTLYHNPGIFPLFKTAMPDSSNMQIVVDTTQALPYTFRYFADSDTLYENPLTGYSKSFAVFVYNQAMEPIHVAEFVELMHTVRQSKDSSGHWVDIERPIHYTCGTGSQSVVIPPGHILVAQTLRREGDTKAECRLRFKSRLGGGNVYSNTFIDYINAASLSEQKQTNRISSQY
jgi:hypothetical protein